MTARYYASNPTHPGWKQIDNETYLMVWTCMRRSPADFEGWRIVAVFA